MNPHGTRNQPDEQRDALARQFGAPAFKAGDAVPGLSSWILERKLGGGGFGAVWLARHAIDRERKPVAFKFCTDPAARHRLVTHERNVVARVMQHAGKHPNIVPLLEYNLDGDVPWLMYEYVEGGTLRELMDEWQALPLPKRLGRAVKVLHQIAGALAAMHRLNPAIVHRDLKPANVLMAGAVPRVTDFGIGSVALPETNGDETGALTAGAAKLPTDLLRSGTALYSSPEQRLGAPPSPRDDVYSLGVIALQFATGDHTLQPGTDTLSTLQEAHVPEELAQLIVRSVALDTNRRPKDAGEWETTLGALVARPDAQLEGTDTHSPSKPFVIPTPETKPLGHDLAPTELPPTKPVATEAPRDAGLVVILAVAFAAVLLLFIVLGHRKPNDTADGQLEQQPRVPELIPHVPTFPANPKAGDECDIEIAPNTKMRFCFIPAGECQLGSPKAERDAVLKLINEKTEPSWLADEDEINRGKFSTIGFWMGKYEVTQSEWAAVMRGTPLEAPSQFRLGGWKEKALGTIKDTRRFPVETVSWDDCQEFLKRANAHRDSLGTKGAFDLPHEDEWEYACRGGLGNRRPFHFGDALNGAQANCEGNFPFGTTTKSDYLERPQPVGSYEAKVRHPWKLCDMHGNVWEWCKNSYENEISRVLRGGSWGSYGLNCRAAHRNRRGPVLRGDILGVRLLFPKP